MSGPSRKERLEEMLQVEPDDAELRYMLAMEYVSSGDDAGAVQCFAELLQRNAQYAPAYHQGGRALVRLNRIPEAQEMLRKGIVVARQGGNEHAAGEMTELLEGLE